MKNEQDAEEIVQDAFFKAYKAIDQFRGKAKFSTWLYRIVFNTAISKSRLQQLRTEALQESSTESHDFTELDNVLQKVLQQERRKYIKLALAKLDELDYAILTLYYYQEEPLKEISQSLNLETTYLKVRLHRARAKLFSNLKNILKTEIRELL